MSTPLSDILALLDRWPKWKAINSTPERLDALEKRFAELQEKAQPTPILEGRECPVCGAALTLISEHDDVHLDAPVKVHELCCVPCGFETERRFPPENVTSERLPSESSASAARTIRKPA